VVRAQLGMSQVRKAAQATELLQEEDYFILKEFVRSLKNFDRITVEIAASLSGQPRDRVSFHLSKLAKIGLVNGDALGFKLLGEGLDALALHGYAEAGLLARLGPSIAVGKESDVFEAMDKEERSYALKFFRLGRISFRDIKRKRGYASSEDHAWLMASVNAAAREARMLKAMEGRDLPVPSVKSFLYHTVMMVMNLGVPLYKVKSLDDAGQVLDSLVSAIRGFTRAGVVHGDLSEYNVLLTAEHRVVVIDWPQAVQRSHPNADEYLRRDVQNVVRFFNRRYGLTVDSDAVLKTVLG
jgi:RIO kinase 2